MRSQSPEKDNALEVEFIQVYSRLSAALNLFINPGRRCGLRRRLFFKPRFKLGRAARTRTPDATQPPCRRLASNTHTHFLSGNCAFYNDKCDQRHSTFIVRVETPTAKSFIFIKYI
ncbi:hypothetical protein PoB_004726400 [Plakobranchus ocellatus]|uniref:Uncharacterized protein n=1 Tax=Plakobranchus ocellatus TaxID=259542 RepID=A0AAV4BQZ0_9GAST|nr:hypothetical protein PoB_004726400 [Plakobranchus ocellatus]